MAWKCPHGKVLSSLPPKKSSQDQRFQTLAEDHCIAVQEGSGLFHVFVPTPACRAKLIRRQSQNGLENVRLPPNKVLGKTEESALNQ